MNKKDYFSRLQGLLGVSRQELVIVLIIASGLTAGLIYNPPEQSNPGVEETINILDSLAEARRKTYTGTNPDGSINREVKTDSININSPKAKPGKEPKSTIMGKIDLNSASKAKLIKLNGIGEKTAVKIINYRKKTPFRKVEDIMNVKGIGPKKFEKMKEFIEVK